MTTADRLAIHLGKGGQSIGGGKPRPLIVRVGHCEVRQKRRELLQAFVGRALDEIRAARAKDQVMRTDPDIEDGEQQADEVRQ